MVREFPGQVSFFKLLFVEILINKSFIVITESKTSMVIKNEELPLQNDNHCRQLFKYIKEAIEECRNLYLIKSITE